MTDTLNPPVSEPCREPMAERPGRAAPQQAPVKPKLISEAARKRRLEEKFGPAMFTGDFLWLGLTRAAGLYFLLFPLRRQIEQRARRHRNNAEAFRQSVSRLIEKRRGTDRRYRKQTDYLAALCNRIKDRFGELQSTEAPVLSRHKRQRINAVADWMLGVQWVPGPITDAQAQELFRLMARLATPGKDFDPFSRNCIEIWRSGVHGGSKIAQRADPQAWARADTATREELRQKALKAISYYRRTSDYSRG